MHGWYWLHLPFYISFLVLHSQRLEYIWLNLWICTMSENFMWVFWVEYRWDYLWLKFLFIKFPQCEFKMFHYQEIIWDDQLSWSVLHTDDVISKFKMIWHWVEICWKHGNIAIQCSCVILLNIVQSKCTLLECAKVVHFYCWNMSNSTYQKEADVTPYVKFWKSVWRCLKILLCIL